MKNYKVLFSLRVLKNVLTVFLDIFLVYYFLNTSNGNDGSEAHPYELSY